MPSRGSSTPSGSPGAGVGLQVAISLLRVGDGRVPFVDLAGTLFVLALLLGLGAAAVRPPFGVGVAAAAALAAGAAVLVPAGPRAGAVDAAIAPLAVHAGLLVVAYAALLLAAVAGAAYILGERALKGRRPGSLLFRLPPLETAGAVLDRSLVMGVTLFTLGLAAGTAWLAGRTGAPFAAEPKIVAAWLLWCYYAATVILSRGAGGRGRAARMSIGGAAGIVVVLVGLSFAPGLHGAP